MHTDLGGPTEAVCNKCGHYWTQPHEYDLERLCETCGTDALVYFPLRIVGNAGSAQEHAAAVWDWLHTRP